MSDDPLLRAEARITELEVRYTLQKEQLDELSKVLYAQQRLLESLLKRVDAMERRHLSEGNVEPSTDPEADVPPHY